MEALRHVANIASKVLIVDQDASLRAQLVTWLNAEGYNCQDAETVDEARTILVKQAFALVIGEVGLPSAEGLEFLRQTHGLYPDTPFVVLASSDDYGTALQALVRGAYGYILKPCTSLEVIMSVVSAMERASLERKLKAEQARLHEEVKHRTRQIEVASEELSLRLITAQSCRNDESPEHIRRMGEYGEVMARHGLVDREDTELYHAAVPLHDIGKIGVPDAVLLKQSELTEVERRIMRTHTTIGAWMLGGSEIKLIQLARDIALYHHEHWDGSGYPMGTAGSEIPRAARMTAILDTYDSMLSLRPHRPPISLNDTLEHLESESGVMYDPELVTAFMRLLPEINSIREANPDKDEKDRRLPGATLAP